MSQDYLSDIVIIDAARSAIGSTHKALKGFSAAQIASKVIQDLLSRNRIKKNLIDQVIIGNAVSAGTGQNISREASCLAGLPAEVPAFSVNHVCGSGLQAVILGAQAIACGEARAVFAGGAESASQTPSLILKNKDALAPVDSLIYDGLTCNLTHRHMGELAELITEKYKISRKEQDQFAFSSHVKAQKAIVARKFHEEIVAIEIAKGSPFDQDQRVRKNIDLEHLSALPAVFKENGTVSAGNSSIPSDGAAVLLLTSKDAARDYQLKPIARILSHVSVGVEPHLVFTAAIKGIKECLMKTGLSFNDIDLFEISEAFAVQALLTQRELKIPENKLNIYGGDVALGHPLGAAGSRILVTLLHALKNEKKSKGLAAICLGGGQAVAMAVEIVS